MGIPGRTVRLAALAAVLAAGGAIRAEEQEARPPEITKGELRDLVRRLASDDWEGRESGAPGCDRAAELVASELAGAGVKPFGDDGTFFQRFTIPRGTKVLPSTALAVVSADGKAEPFDLAQEFVPLSISAAGVVEAEAVFAGYGISAPGVGYDDYAGLDAKGRVVVVLRHAPAYRDKKSPFASQTALQSYASFQAKADAAVAAGAAALVVVNDPESSKDRDEDVLQPPGGTTGGKIPVLQVTWRAGRRLGSALGVPLATRQRQIDGKLEPRSEALPGPVVHLRCDLEPDVRDVRNVVGLLEPEGAAVTGDGAASVARETVVVGAHYDHVGRGWFGSLANAGGKIHNGADDNASGTSSLCEIAGRLAPERARLRRRVLFLAFSGEELGLLGSKHWCEKPLVPLAETVAMVNLDMVGRLNKNRLFVGGTGTSPVWPGLLETLNEEGRFQLVSWPGGKAPSDHASFYDRGLPVLFFFTGLHGDYHRPSDDWDTLEYEGQARVARMAAAVVLDLATRPERPAFTKCDAGGFEVGPYTGIAVEQRPEGVFVVHLDDRSPGKKARFKEGDRIVDWNGTPIPDTNAWNDAVSKAKPSDKVEVGVSRDGKALRIRLTLGST